MTTLSSTTTPSGIAYALLSKTAVLSVQIYTTTLRLLPSRKFFYPKKSLLAFVHRRCFATIRRVRGGRSVVRRAYTTTTIKSCTNDNIAFGETRCGKTERYPCIYKRSKTAFVQFANRRHGVPPLETTVAIDPTNAVISAISAPGSP